ncbi:MAG: hypothetical protein KJ057_14630 [Phycisphaerae bacterium]|nr:hypothetical protein [Planctomycetia bacterium]MCK6466459.1 hypothetical protein [Phycisphaerae bacterium]MCL4719703.1 hypothetical protein [Phycisphaerae bacterium]NUQ10634.1 hypothetical protein [Phycisphaerae bacterium]
MVQPSGKMGNRLTVSGANVVKGVNDSASVAAAPPSSASLTQEALYAQGSSLCSSYSDRTMRIRTMAQQLIIAYGVSVGFSISTTNAGFVLLFGGGTLMIFGSALWVLNQHYSLAFNEVRNASLVPMEQMLLGTALIGPWTAHGRVRGRHGILTRWAWHGPFLATVMMGLVGALLGVCVLLAGGDAVDVLVGWWRSV